MFVCYCSVSFCFCFFFCEGACYDRYVHYPFRRQRQSCIRDSVPGFMVGKAAEQGGIAKHSAKLVYAMSCSKVPRFTVVVGGSYGAGNYGMCGRGFRPNMMFAWPNSVVATMSPDIGTNVVLELARSSISKKATPESLAQLEKETRELYADKSDPYFATSRIWDDGIIEPEQTRDVLALCLSVAATNPPDEGSSYVYRM